MKNGVASQLRLEIAQKALEQGFDDVGFCTAAPFSEWRDNAYEQVRRRLSHDPAALMPDARTVVVAVRRYKKFGAWPEGSATIANYYVNSAVGFERIKSVAALLVEQGHKVIANPLLPAKQAALRAGLGTQGMNTQFCHNTFGMLVSIHMALTDADLDGLEAPRRECGMCGECASACTGGAIYPGFFDHDRCLRFLMASGTVVPVWAREMMGLRLTGCTDCQHACGKAASETVGVPEGLAWACDIAGLLRGERERYDKLGEYIGENFARMKRIRPQAALCAGNSGSRAYVPLLVPLLREEGEALRSHAAWALGRLGGEEARSALQAALASERDEGVRREISAALDQQ